MTYPQKFSLFASVVLLIGAGILFSGVGRNSAVDPSKSVLAPTNIFPINTALADRSVDTNTTQ